ncbi:MAG: PIN domain-containing protein [Nitrosomonas sp.]|nr:PIN domain-containing protein [Nitrosomonas sp.]
MKAMANNALAVSSYNFTSDDELLLDTNIWLFVYGPQRPDDPRVAIYSQAFAKILAAGCKIYIDVLIVSEFINTYARIKWDVLGKPYKDFKKFRKSQDFKPIAQDIAADIQQILKHCLRIENGFGTLAINELIAEYAVGNSDFNDQIITELCQKKKLKLITDDSDFRAQGVLIMTANKRLLSSQQSATSSNVHQK